MKRKSVTRPREPEIGLPRWSRTGAVWSRTGTTTAWSCPVWT
ncbi:hypothetical protein AB6O49_18965 [Streptomyces sp. SBR177]